MCACVVFLHTSWLLIIDCGINCVCSGLTSVYRSKAGGQDLEDDDEDGAVNGDEDDTEINYRNNNHWKRAADCGLSNYVSYYDAASLYPSSGKKTKP